jgi:UDP-glucose 4-epimerase
MTILELAQRVIDVLGSDSTIEMVEYADAYTSGFEDLRHRKPDLTRLRSIVDFEYAYSLDDTITDMASVIQQAQSKDGSLRGEGV